MIIMNTDKIDEIAAQIARNMNIPAIKDVLRTISFLKSIITELAGSMSSLEH